MKYSKVVPGATIYKITTTLILNFNATPIYTFSAIVLLARYSKVYTRLFCCYITSLPRFFITTLIIGVLKYTIIPISTFSDAFVCEIQ